MLIQSSEYPSKFFKHQDKIFINDLSSVEEITQDFDGQKTIVYSYEHYPLNVSDRVDLSHYIESNYTLLLNKSKSEFEQYQIQKALTPSQDEVEKAKREIETVELLIDLGVL